MKRFLITLLLSACAIPSRFDELSVEGRRVYGGIEFDIRTFGALTTSSDNSDFIQAAVDACNATGNRCTVYVPAGTWLVKRQTVGDQHVIKVKSNVRIAGDGPESVLKIADGEGTSALYLLECEDVSNIEVTNLTLDGNRDNLTSPDEQTHNLLLDNSDYVTVRDVHFINMHGDGIKMQGSSSGPNRDHRVLNSLFRDGNRSGISTHLGSQGVLIQGNVFERITDQFIDAEPSGGVAADTPRWINIVANTFDNRDEINTNGNVLTISGAATEQPALYFNVSTNIFRNGQMTGVWTSNASIVGNQVIAKSGSVGIEISRYSKDVTIKGNQIVTSGTADGIHLSSTSGSLLSRATIQGNTITSENRGINLESTLDILVTGNVIFRSGSSPTGSIGIHVQTAIADTGENIAIVGNTLLDWETAATLHSASGGGQKLDRPLFANNNIDSTVTNAIGLYWDNSGTTNAIVSGNSFGAGIVTPIAQPGNAYPVTIAGAGIGDVAWLNGSADPTAGGGVVALLGSLYSRTDGAISRKVGSSATAWRYAGFPPGFVSGMQLSRSSASAVQIAAGSCRASNVDHEVVTTGTLTATITTSGANGLDTGSEAADTWYAVYVIWDTTGVNAAASLLSTSFTAPTMPSGYDARRRVGAVRNNGSSNFWFWTQRWNGNTRRYWYDEERADLQVLTAGSATTFTAQSLATLVPPSSDNALLEVALDTGAGGTGDGLTLRPTGGNSTDGPWRFAPGLLVTDPITWTTEMLTDSSQSIDYLVSNALNDADIYVLGFDDEI